MLRMFGMSFLYGTNDGIATLGCCLSINRFHTGLWEMMLSAIMTNPAPGQQERTPRAGAVNTKL
jgi:hypothetical protein